MVGRQMHMTQRDLSGTNRCSSSATAAPRGDGRARGAKSRRAGVRGVVVAMKPGNSGRAKGSRKMDDE
jgi:hypothetical protein